MPGSGFANQLKVFLRTLGCVALAASYGPIAVVQDAHQPVHVGVTQTRVDVQVTHWKSPTPALAGPGAGSGCRSAGPSDMTTSDVWFYEEFLPSGVSWSVTLGGRTQSGMIAGDPPTGGGRNLTFTEPPGTYPFTVGAVAGYSSFPSLGQVNLTFANRGGVSQEIIEFTPNPPENATPSPQGFLGFSGSSGYYWIISVAGAILLGALAYYLSDRKGQISGTRDGLKIQVYDPRAPSGEWIHPPPNETEPDAPDEPN